MQKESTTFLHQLKYHEVTTERLCFKCLALLLFKRYDSTLSQKLSECNNKQIAINCKTIAGDITETPAKIFQNTTKEFAKMTG